MRRTTQLLLVVWWIGLAGAVRAADSLIVPGQRVGPAILGQKLEQLTVRVGAGKAYRSKDYTNILYQGFTVVVSNIGNQTINAVVVTDPPYHLKNGVGIGSTEGDVVKLLGQPTKSQAMSGSTRGMIDKSLNYAKLGLTLALARSKVVQIGIYPVK